MVRTADLPDLSTPTDASLIVADKATSTGRFTALALKNYAIAGLGSAASVTAEAAARVAARTALSAAEYAVVGDGVTDDTAALQAAIDAATAAALPLFIPPGRYLLSAALTVERGVRIFGVQPEPFVLQFQATPATGGEGTWLFLDGSDLVSVFDIKPAGIVSQQNETFAVEISHLGILHTQPVPAPAWAPYNYPAAFALGGASDIHIHDIMLLNPTIGFKTTAEGGRLTIERIRGQPLLNAMILDNQTDVVRVSDCHFWVYWSLDANVLDYQKANAVVYQLGRIDNPIFTNNFCIWYRIGVHVVATASGICSKANFVNCGFDSCGFMCVVNDAIGTHTLSFTAGYAQGDPTVSTTSPAVQITGSGSGTRIALTDCMLTTFATCLVIISSTGTNNRVVISGGSELLFWDQAVGGNAALNCNPDNAIWADSTCHFFSNHNPTGITGGSGFVAREPVMVRGLGTVISGTTSIVVPHAFGFAPLGIMLTPRGDLGSATNYWWTATAADYTIHVDVDPGINVGFDALLLADNTF